jgi:hypothetical protein
METEMTNQNPTDADDSPTDQAITSFREFRTYARDDLDTVHHDVYPWTGLISDPRLREVLAFMKETYDPGSFVDRTAMPHKFEHTEFFNRAINKWATESATTAVREGNVSQTAYITGLPGYDSDISGLHAINRLADWLVNSEQCKLIYCAALMGRGKTDFSLLLFEIIHDHFRRIRRHQPDDVEISDDILEEVLDGAEVSDDVEASDEGEVPDKIPDDVLEEILGDVDQDEVISGLETPEFATNFAASTPRDVDAEIKEIHSYSGLLEWAEGGSSEDEKWFIFDEASTELTAQSGANAQEVAEVFAPFIKKMRKKGVNMIVVGHDRGDVHPAIRSIASFIDKESTKTAEIYEGIKRREPYGHYLSLDSIPQTSWKFDTDDVAHWEFDVEPVDDVDPETDDSVMTEDEWKQWRNERAAALYEATEFSWPDIVNALDLDITSDGLAKACRDVEVDVEPAPPKGDEEEAIAD